MRGWGWCALGYFQWGISLPCSPGQHRTYTRRLCPTEATQWTHLTWCCLLQVHQGGPVGSGVLGQLGSRCCSYRLSMALLWLGPQSLCGGFWGIPDGVFRPP